MPNTLALNSTKQVDIFAGSGDDIIEFEEFDTDDIADGEFGFIIETSSEDDNDDLDVLDLGGNRSSLVVDAADLQQSALLQPSSESELVAYDAAAPWPSLGFEI